MQHAWPTASPSRALRQAQPNATRSEGGCNEREQGAARAVTWGPTASTSATPSCPGTPGSSGVMGYLPWMVLMSDGLMGACRARTGEQGTRGSRWGGVGCWGLDGSMVEVQVATYCTGRHEAILVKESIYWRPPVSSALQTGCMADGCSKGRAKLATPPSRRPHQDPCIASCAWQEACASRSNAQLTARMWSRTS